MMSKRNVSTHRPGIQPHRNVGRIPVTHLIGAGYLLEVRTERLFDVLVGPLVDVVQGVPPHNAAERQGRSWIVDDIRTRARGTWRWRQRRRGGRRGERRAVVHSCRWVLRVGGTIIYVHGDGDETGCVGKNQLMDVSIIYPRFQKRPSATATKVSPKPPLAHVSTLM